MVIFEDLGLNFRYGLAGIASVCSEWYAFECVSLGASYLGKYLSLCRKVCRFA
jgi:MATE family multidrug resistance protein